MEIETHNVVAFKLLLNIGARIIDLSILWVFVGHRIPELAMRWWEV